MDISPYLEKLLKNWGRAVRFNKSPWYNFSPYLKEFVGKTTRTPVFTEEFDEIEDIGKYINTFNDDLKIVLIIRFAWAFKSQRTRARAARMEYSVYTAHLREAIKRLEAFVLIDKTA